MYSSKLHVNHDNFTTTYFLLGEMHTTERAMNFLYAAFFFFWGKIRHFQQISRWVLPQTFVLCLHRTRTFDTYISKMLLILPIFFSNFGPEIVQMQAACFEHWSKHNIVFLGWVFGADSRGPLFGQENSPGFFSDQFLISTKGLTEILSSIAWVSDLSFALSFWQ